MRRMLVGLVALVLIGCDTQPTVAPIDDDEYPINQRLALDDGDLLRARLIAQADIARARASGSETNLRLAYAQYLSVAANDVDRARRSIEYAVLLIEDGAYDEAAVHLRSAIDMPKLEPELRVAAARMLVETTVELWKQLPDGEARSHGATRVRELLHELQTEHVVWAHPSAAKLREQAPAILVAASWDIAREYEREGNEHGDQQAFAHCAQELLGTYNSFEDVPDPGAVLQKAADCSMRAYMVGQALQILTAVVERHGDSPQARDAMFTIAETYRSVLYYREALEHYRAFVQRHPDDERASLARTRWLQLALALGDPVADIIAIWQTGTLDERMLAAAVEFRTARQRGDIEAMSEYLERHRADGGTAREIAARIAIAAEAMRSSCPDSARASGLCTRVSADGRLGEVLHRNARAKLRAERELELARELMREATWMNDPLAAAGAPLALEREELLELEATAALLVGDLSAEEALGVQPPRTYEPSRTRIWLEERKTSVAAMISAYELVGANDPARAAAAAERTAQVYESDATLLARVELELIERGSTEFARELAEVEAERTAQALAAYQGCLAAIAAHGDDPADVQHACKLGVARLCGRHDLDAPWADDSSLRTLVLGTN
jgi:hypothetical protein